MKNNDFIEIGDHKGILKFYQNYKMQQTNPKFWNWTLQQSSFVLEEEENYELKPTDKEIGNNFLWEVMAIHR